jgi:hypothetical protein
MRVPAVEGTARVLPLPSFILRPFTAMIIAAVHVYLALSHLMPLLAGDWQWTHIWKGFGALAGAYVFVALASRGLARRSRQQFGNDARIEVTAASRSSV